MAKYVFVCSVWFVLCLFHIKVSFLASSSCCWFNPKKTPTKTGASFEPQKNTPQPLWHFWFGLHPSVGFQLSSASDAAFEAAAMAWHPTTKYYCVGLGPRPIILKLCLYYRGWLNGRSENGWIGVKRNYWSFGAPRWFGRWDESIQIRESKFPFQLGRVGEFVSGCLGGEIPPQN